MSIPPARSMALKILGQTLDQDQDVQAAVDRVLKAAPEGPDQGLATELVYGYLRYKGRLNFIVHQLLKNPAKTPPIMQRILGLAAYELLFLDRVPAYATLNWAVNLVRKKMNTTMGQVSNAVLRNLIRLGSVVHQPSYYQDKTTSYAAYLSAWYSAPLWLVQLWLQDYGPKIIEIYLASTLQSPPIGLRINAQNPKAQEVRQQLSSQGAIHGSWAITMPQRLDLLQDLLAQGQISYQSLAAQQIMHALQAQEWPTPILDACAGRGGKTFFLAELGKEVWASDLNTFRLQQFRQEAKRLGLLVPVFQASGIAPYPLQQAPATILLDVPCSGLGVLSRRPDIKWKRTIENCTQLVSLQKKLLHQAAQVLMPGGLLVYLTCTLAKQENELQIENFIQEYSEFSLVHQIQSSSDGHEHEFFYGAVLKKEAH